MARGKPKALPFAAVLRGLERRPKHVRLGADKPDSPSWRFILMDLDFQDEWGWPFVTGPKLTEIVVFLKEMERLTWTEIRQQMTGGERRRGEKHKYIPTDHCCDVAQRRLEELELDEYADSWFRFRLANQERLWGVVQDRIFYPVWWDHDHNVCPSRDQD
jgi:hypothetical protein